MIQSTQKIIGYICTSGLARYLDYARRYSFKTVPFLCVRNAAHNLHFIRTSQVCISKSLSLHLRILIFIIGRVLPLFLLALDRLANLLIDAPQQLLGMLAEPLILVLLKLIEL